MAAFAKRLSRLTLVAPPEDILIILLFIGNLLLRHPGLKCLIDHPRNNQQQRNNNNSSSSEHHQQQQQQQKAISQLSETGAGDPFLMEERDPLQSQAMLSSLWEIKALQCHILPSVAAAARFIREPLPTTEYDMGTALERTGGHIFDRELKSKVKDIMLTFERPSSMALPKGERIIQYWQLTTI